MAPIYSSNKEARLQISFIHDTDGTEESTGRPRADSKMYTEADESKNQEEDDLDDVLNDPDDSSTLN